MKDYWFFFSYARRDSYKNIYLKTFYEELAREIAVAAGLPSKLKETDIGFFDRENIELGHVWDDTVAEAIQSSKAFVALYSPAYFNSEVCGQEFQLFKMRLEDYRKKLSPQDSQPSLFIPVLWQPLERLPSTLPESIAKLQFTHASLPAKYENDGLNFLMKNKNARRDFIRRLADSINKEVNAHKLPRLQNPPPLTDIPNAFNPQPIVVTAQPQIAPAPGAPAVAAQPPDTHYVPKNYGLDVAWFVYVAGKNADYKTVREHIDCYGAVGGKDWRPYYPEVESKVGLIAQGVASSKDLLAETLPLSDELVTHLREAEAKNTIVIILVDPWSVGLPSFKKPLKDYDNNRLLNSGAMVIWNHKDPETVTAANSLKQTLVNTFPNILVSNDVVFQNNIDSEQQLRDRLSDLIDEVRKKIIARENLLRPVTNTPNSSFPTLTVPTPQT
jgi:FxsC-like protein